MNEWREGVREGDVEQKRVSDCSREASMIGKEK